ncbi:MAG TPA: PepSY domain-containing protein [Mycobacteriales bacterium]|nr:PepSY domain-containing protein [Mycobacteriales bacterium]
MTSTPTVSAEAARTATGPVEARSGGWAAVRPLVMRLHFYAGIFIAPFLLISAVTGLLYTAAPQIEHVLYKHELTVPISGDGHRIPLQSQIRAARTAQPVGAITAVRPAAGAHATTRVVFDGPGIAAGYSRTAFVDPYTGQVRGVLKTYGEWLPARAWLDSLHRTLLLGTPGRIYSETSASWLWVIVLAGAALWLGRRRTGRRNASGRRSRMLNWHGLTGITLGIGFLFLSATGLTWSHFAGDRISSLRAEFGGSTPAVATTLHNGSKASRTDIGMDAVLASARRAGLSDPVEITPPAAKDQAYTVQQVQRHWPEKQDSVAIDPHDGRVLHRLRFADYPLAAKLTRWGIDAHMGLLFGLANQIVLAILAIGLICLIFWGYRMWWLRRPVRSAARMGRPPVRGAWRRIPGRWSAALILTAAVIGYLIPLLGISLVLFLILDGVLHLRARTGPEAA